MYRQYITHFIATLWTYRPHTHVQCIIIITYTFQITLSLMRKENSVHNEH